MFVNIYFSKIENMILFNYSEGNDNMSISSINREIAVYKAKIIEYNKFIGELNDLKVDVRNSSNKLKESGDALGEGLVLDGRGADNGRLREIANELDGSIRSIDSSITAAKNDITKFNNKIDSLEREKKRLEREERERKKRESKSKISKYASR